MSDNPNALCKWVYGVRNAYVGAMAFALIWTTGVATQLGWLQQETLAYETLALLMKQGLSKAVVFAFIALTFFHAAHQVPATLRDLGVRVPRAVTTTAGGLAALTGSFWAARVIFGF